MRCLPAPTTRSSRSVMTVLGTNRLTGVAKTRVWLPGVTLTRMRAADRGWGRLLDHLAAAGPSSIDDLRTELRLKRQELKSLRAPLERCGAIISRSLQVTAGEGHRHSSELARWDQAYPGTGGTESDPGRSLGGLVAAGVRAAVVAPEAELRRWFSWQWYWTDTLIDDLIREGQLRRVDGHVMAAGQN